MQSSSVPWWRVRGMHPRMMGMTKPCLSQSESWIAWVSTNRRARFAAGRFPCVRCLWPVDPAVHCTVRYSRVNCPTPYHRFIIILVVVILLSCFYQARVGHAYAEYAEYADYAHMRNMRMRIENLIHIFHIQREKTSLFKRQ